MKSLSLIVSCYNSEDYVERCVNSLLLGGEEVEILLVDDGSNDRTPQIIDYYAHKFPGIVRAIHQANGGPGAAINAGLHAATGLYTKIVDSDDWLDATAYQQVLDFLRETNRQGEALDMIVSNYIYDRQGARHKKVMRYPTILPQGQVFGWQDVRFPAGKYLLMHAIIYRTSLLRDEAKLELPRHTFYVDNIYVFEPLPFVKKIYYLNVELYHYFIGRADQSVNEDVMLSRIDQQLKINRRLIIFYAENITDSSPVSQYMEKYVEIITTVSSILLVKGGTPRYLALKKDLWRFVKQYDETLYKQLCHGAFGIGVHLPGKIGRKTAVGAYHIAQRMYGFN